MNVLDLFSGIGGMSLGLERAGMRTTAFCEIDPFCRRVLAKHWPGVPIHEDVRELTADAVGPVDVIAGGFPCQPWSVAGQQRGAEDDRDLWPEMARLVAECRPRWVLGENVSGLVAQPMGLDRVLSDLEALGYASRTFAIPACAVDAPHIRQRVWIVAHAAGKRRPDRDGEPRQGRSVDERSAGEPQRLCGSELAHAGHDEPSRRDNSTANHDRCCGARGQPRDELASRGSISMAHANDARPQERAGERGDDGPEREAVVGSGHLEHATGDGRGEGRAEHELRSRRASAAEHGGLGDAAGFRRESLSEIPHSNGEGESGTGCSRQERWRTGEPARAGAWSDADFLRCEFDGKIRRVKPGVRLLVDGLPGRVARLKALGNSVVPQVVEQIGRAMMVAGR